MKTFSVHRTFGGQVRVSRVSALTAGEAVEKAMKADGTAYEVKNSERPGEIAYLTGNGLQVRWEES